MKPTSRFDWFHQECAEIRSRRFHLFEPAAPEALQYRHLTGVVDLTGTYADFLREFGLCKLFTDHRDAPMVSVYPLEAHRRHECADGSRFVGFGFRGQQSVYFDEVLILASHQSAVFTVTRQAGKQISPSFSDWVHQAYDWAKGKYSQKQWKNILTGPPPFTAGELSVVDARKRFSWSLIGFGPNGDALFEIANHSSRTIPWLTLGIRDRSRAVLDGAVWLDVGHIRPGETGLVAKDCYKDRITSDALEPFDLPDPIPEKRERYWEFR